MAANLHKNIDLNDLDAIVAAVLDVGRQTDETAETLPPEAYSSQAFYDLEVHKIFLQDWTCVGHVSQIPNVGDYFTIDMFGEMLVVVRAKDRIRVMSRICRHRWAPVVGGTGNARAFVCPFHNWSYGLDGRLISGPFMNKAVNFDRADCVLPEVRTEVIEELGFIFVTFSDSVDPIGERIKDMTARLKNYHVNELVVVKPLFLDSPFNWKFVIETGMEAYHHFGTHREGLEKIYPTRLTWCEDGRKGWTISHSPAIEARPDVTLPVFPDLEPDEVPGLDLYHIYPLTRLGVYPDRIRLQTVIPVSPNRTLRRTVYLVRPEVAAQKELVDEGFKPLLNSNTTMEDNLINIAQQAAVESRLLSIGRLSHLEATVWHFAEYIRERLRANS